MSRPASKSYFVSPLVAAFLTFTLFSAIARTEERLPIRVGIELNFEPYDFVDKAGEPDGFAVDLLKAIARHSNLKLENEVGFWSHLRDEVEQGRLDLVTTMAKSPEREKAVLFSHTVIVSYDAIFVRADEGHIQSEADLFGRKVIVQTGDLADDYIKTVKYPVQVVRSATLQDAFKLLNLHQGDAVIASQTAALVTLGHMEEGKNVRLAAEPHFGQYKREYAYAVRRGFPELVDRINAGLSAATATGEYGWIFDKWFSDIDPGARDKARRFEQLSYLLLAATAIAIISMMLVLFFRSEVSRKTRSLSESEARFRGLVENLPGVVFRCEKRERWRMEFLSEAIETVTGYPAADFTSGARTFLSVIHPDDRGETVARIGAHMAGRFEYDFRIVAKNGSVRWLHARGGPAKTKSIPRIDGIFLDITEQRSVSDLLVQQQTRMASSARLSALGEMAGGIAHEINNPLAIINLRTHQLQMHAAKGPVNPADAITIATGIEATSIRISKIVKSLQTVARESEHDPFETIPLKAIIGDAFELCYQRMKKHGIEVSVDDIPDDLELECRRVQVSQVLINLLNNAFDAVVTQPARYIRISARRLVDVAGEWVEIAIVDSGRGLSADLAQKIFQPFFTTKGVGKGTGLGLSISKGMIEAHDGHISLDTSYPTTRFVIVLPQSQTLRRADLEGVLSPLLHGEGPPISG